MCLFYLLISALTEQKQQWVKLLVPSHEIKAVAPNCTCIVCIFSPTQAGKRNNQVSLTNVLDEAEEYYYFIKYQPLGTWKNICVIFFFELQAELLAFFTEHIFIRRNNWQTMVIQTGLFVRQAFSQNEWSNYFKKKVFVPMMMKI